MESATAVSAAVAAGPALVGSSRGRQAGEPQWTWGAEGQPVEQAARVAREAAPGGLVVTREVAAALSDRFSFQPTPNGVYGVVAVTDDERGAMRRLPDRRLTTILVTDVVGSTSTVERVGDRAGGELLAANERVTRAELALYGGEEIDTAGDGFLAAFDSPARAIRCGFAVIARVADLGLVIRAGVHTGELEQVEGSTRGIALHVAARIAGHAAPGEVLVSATTRELAAGAGFGFVDRGEHTLKGVSDPRRLFAVEDRP
jgi:class 3 adenylate cyclase